MSQRHIPDDLLEWTITIWQPCADRPLTQEDVREIVENVSGFFELLLKWDTEATVSHLVDDDMDTQSTASDSLSEDQSA